MNNSYKIQSKKVGDYYNQWQQHYNDVYGDTIQAYRPKDKNELMQYIAQSSDIADGMKVLDAGCGICGPAIWLAKHYNVHITGVTVSQIQVEQSIESIRKNCRSEAIEVLHGDYHELSSMFKADTFDRILFLESLGHAADVSRVIGETYKVLKPGGCIYIKDFYYKEPSDNYWNKRIEKVVANINRLYSYNTLNLNKTLTALRSQNFEIDFVKKFSFSDDISIRYEFEQRFGIDIFNGESEFYPAEWLEIKCKKSSV
jgi:cyclopropane fatty-acyl-phospholipid synthase-like methyltransferase